MTPELVVAGFLEGDSTVVGLVGTRIAASQLPQNTTYPAIVYETVDIIPDPNLNYADGQDLLKARMAITVIAATIPVLKSVHAAIRTAMDHKYLVTVATKTVRSSRLALLGPLDRDNEAGLWVQTADYIIAYYD